MEEHALEKAARRVRQRVADAPRMVALWDAEANGDIEAKDVGSRSSHRRFWKCAVAEDHRWQAAPAAISRSLEKGFTGCPCCAGRKLSRANNFAYRYPDAVRYWHPTRNGVLLPSQVLGGSPDPVWWQCPVGPDHEWQNSPLVLGRMSASRGNSGCPFCRGLRASVTNSVASHPVLLAEWHPRNVRRPEDVVAGTSEKLWWRCRANPQHEWQATGANRTRNRGCPMCKKSLTSMLEVGMGFELQTLFPTLDLSDDKVVVEGVIFTVDLHLRDVGVVIEVDGRHRHAEDKALARDVAKSQVLASAGLRVVRVREAPLEPLSGTDVVIPRNSTIKQATDAVLVHLHELEWLPVEIACSVAEYLAEPAERRVGAALAAVQAERPGKRVRLPGPTRLSRAERWDAAMTSLRAFVDREGHALVRDEHVEDGFALGKWVGSKRTQYRRRRLEPDRAAQLEALPGWTWDAVAAAWEDGFDHLLSYFEAHGNVNVGAEYKAADGYPLGSWVRSHHRPHGRRGMSNEQRARLSAVPGWVWRSNGPAPGRQTAENFLLDVDTK